MRTRISLLLLAAVAVATTPTPARAWDELGHKVVARIAWDNMTPLARQRAVALLTAAPEGAGLRELMPAMGSDRDRDLFVNAGYWPDRLRSRSHPGNRFAHSDWHYVNFFWEQARPGGPAVERPDLGTAGELVTQEQRIAATLGDATRSAEDRAVDLAWLIHLVGDAHQPMHNSARVTPQDPEGDRGGNLFLLAGLYPFNNLHAYWDALVNFTVPWQPDDRTEADYIGSAASLIQRAYPMQRMSGQLDPGAFRDWSHDGLTVAQRAFPVWLARGQRAPTRYRSYAWDLAEPRLALAGYRLADTLNRILGS